MMKENRTGLWVLLGVIVGFSLPVLTCLGLTFVVSLSLSAASSSSQPSPYLMTHISGPIAGPAVAMIDVSGPIVSGRAPSFSNTAMAASGDVIPLIQQAALAADVRAIVLRVNSPGGSVVPSDEIYHALEELRIPVVVLMGDVAASGAYYISAAADHIVANPNTLTGSIGVISTFPVIDELLEKVGVDITTITAGESKDFGSMYRPMTESEIEYWQSLIGEVHEGFIEVVAAGRGMEISEVRELADGRVFSGRQALDLGLVDELGYEEDAVRVAADLGEIPDPPRVIQYQRYSPFSSLFGIATNLRGAGLPADWLQRLLGPTLEFRWVP
jgi:protease-4